MTRHPPGERSKAAGANVRVVREERGWSQRDLGGRLGWDQSMVGRLETGHVNMTIDQLYLLAGALRVRPSRLLRGVE